MPRVGKSEYPRDYVAGTRVPENIHHWLRDYAKRHRKSVSGVLYEWILDIHEKDMKVSLIRNARLKRRVRT